MLGSESDDSGAELGVSSIFVTSVLAPAKALVISFKLSVFCVEIAVDALAIAVYWFFAVSAVACREFFNAMALLFAVTLSELGTCLCLHSSLVHSVVIFL